MTTRKIKEGGIKQANNKIPRLQYNILPKNELVLIGNGSSIAKNINPIDIIKLRPKVDRRISIKIWQDYRKPKINANIFHSPMMQVTWDNLPYNPCHWGVG